MTKRLLSLLLILCFFPGILVFEEELPYVSSVFNERSGLPTGEANDVIQTSDGYLWVGSYGGLIRYDGTEFRNYSTEGILPSSSVRAMYEDSRGRLWIGTNDAGVFIFENGAVTQPEGQPKDNFLCVRGFAEDNEGAVYACSNSGIAEIKDGVMRVYDVPEVAGQTVYSLGTDSFGRLWAADSAGGCVVLKDGKLLHVFKGADIFGGEISVYSLTTGIDGSVWVGSSDNALVQVIPESDGFSESDLRINRFTTGGVNTHNSLRMMKTGELAISGLHGFGVLYPDGSFREFTEAEGAVSVNNSFIDYEGDFWLASSSVGIVRFSEGCFSSPNNAAGLSGIAVNAVARQQGITYIGLDSGLVICGEDWSRRENELTAMFSGVRIRHVLADSRGRVWIASYSEHPVVRYSPDSGEIKTFSSADGLAGDRARVMLELSDGRLAVGTQRGVSVIDESGGIKSYTGFKIPEILSLLEAPDGTLFAGSDGGGIYEIKGDDVIEHGLTDGLSEGVILRMMRDSEDGKYFISAGSSLYYWADGKFTKLSALKKEAGSIFDFCLDGGTLWLLQNNGVIAADRADLLNGGSGNPVTYGFSYGLSGSLNANTWHSYTDGKVYLATRNGISVFGFRVPDNELPKGIINRVTVDGEVYEHPDSLVLPGDTQRITIDFAALTFTGTTRIKAAYQLKGFDAEEIPLDNTKNGSVSYTNLPGGEYTFVFRLYDPDDELHSYTFGFEMSKTKRVTEYTLFKAGMVLLIVLAAAGTVLLIVGARLKTARRRQKEYRDILEQSLLTFAGAIDAKDPYTRGHSNRVANYSRELALRMGLSEQQQEHIYYVALLHDIGKIGIPDSILKKPDKLTAEERGIIETHPLIGAKILKNFTALEGISEGAKYHHERFDGTGYCEGKAGDDIPLVARIICVADTYDTMSSERCYRKPLSREIILEEFGKGVGTQFDPEVVPHMIAMIEEGIVPLEQKDEDDSFEADITPYTAESEKLEKV